MKKLISVISILLALLMIFSFAAAAGSGNGGGGGNGGNSGETLTLISVTIGGTPIAEATEIRGDAELLLTFSADVTDDSVLAFNTGKVKVLDASGNPVSSVSIAKNATKKLSVSLGGVAKGDYTLKIGQKFKDVYGNSLAAEESIPFTVNKGNGTGTGGGSNPLTFGGAKVGEADLSGAKLKGDETIVLQFDRGMKGYEPDNAALIGVYKADGTKADYTVLPVDDSSDEAKRQIKVQLNGLAAGEYTLKIDKDVKANNGNTLGEDVTVSFTVESAEQGNGDTAANYKNIFKSLLDFIRLLIDYIKDLFHSIVK